MQSLNNNKRPNNKNDVITDLGGEGDFPMFRYGVTQPIQSPYTPALTPHRYSQALTPQPLVPSPQDSEAPPLRLPYRPKVMRESVSSLRKPSSGPYALSADW